MGEDGRQRELEEDGNQLHADLQEWPQTNCQPAEVY